MTERRKGTDPTAARAHGLTHERLWLCARGGAQPGRAKAKGGKGIVHRREKKSIPKDALNQPGLVNRLQNGSVFFLVLQKPARLTNDQPRYAPLQQLSMYLHTNAGKMHGSSLPRGICRPRLREGSQ